MKKKVCIIVLLFSFITSISNNMINGIKTEINKKNLDKTIANFTEKYESHSTPLLPITKNSNQKKLEINSDSDLEDLSELSDSIALFINNTIGKSIEIEDSKSVISIFDTNILVNNSDLDFEVHETNSDLSKNRTKVENKNKQQVPNTGKFYGVAVSKETCRWLYNKALKYFFKKSTGYGVSLGVIGEILRIEMRYFVAKFTATTAKSLDGFISLVQATPGYGPIIKYALMAIVCAVSLFLASCIYAGAHSQSFRIGVRKYNIFKWNLEIGLYE